MVFIVRSLTDVVRPVPEGKVIRHDDFWAWRESGELLRSARDQAAAIVNDAQIHHAQERQRGYREGREAALLEQSGTMIGVVNQTHAYFGKVEGRMVDLVLDAVRKVVSDFDDKERVGTVVRNCLDLLRSQKQLSVHVHPSHAPWLRSQLDELRSQYPGIAEIGILPDPRLAADACLIESEIGVVEASLTGQMEVLRSTLAEVFSARVAQAPDVTPDLSSKVSALTKGADSS